MKKILFLLIVAGIVLSNMSLIAANSFSPSQIEVIFVSKAYWDGPSRSCLDREKGCCIHISLKVPLLDHQIFGDLTAYEGQGVKLTFSRKNGIQQETFVDLTRSGRFYIDGEGTLSEDLLKSLKLPLSFKILPGYYPYQEDGDMITVFFNK